jgi:hypothetical protein
MLLYNFMTVAGTKLFCRHVKKEVYLAHTQHHSWLEAHTFFLWKSISTCAYYWRGTPPPPPPPPTSAAGYPGGGAKGLSKFIRNIHFGTSSQLSEVSLNSKKMITA